MIVNSQCLNCKHIFETKLYFFTSHYVKCPKCKTFVPVMIVGNKMKEGKSVER